MRFIFLWILCSVLFCSVLASFLGSLGWIGCLSRELVNIRNFEECGIGLGVLFSGLFPVSISKESMKI